MERWGIPKLLGDKSCQGNVYLFVVQDCWAEIGAAIKCAIQLLFFLLQRINEKPQVVNDYESGRAIPNQQVISKLERAVGVKLRGKDMGQPLHGPKKK